LEHTSCAQELIELEDEELDEEDEDEEEDEEDEEEDEESSLQPGLVHEVLPALTAAAARRAKMTVVCILS
jgi:TATA-binding protein-associated factor Taf7